MAGHIEKLWIGYRDGVIPPDAPQAQFLECKRAFFAGALSLFSAAMGDMFDKGQDEPTEADMRRMQEIEDELQAFGRSGGLL